VALATSREHAELDADNRPLIPLLAARGVNAIAAIWNDSQVRWPEFDLVVIRSTWDYIEQVDAFLRWTRSLPRVLNSALILEWNADKAYLLDLAAAQLPVVPTGRFDPDAEVVLPAAPLVVKPSLGCAANNVAWYEPGQERQALRHIERLQAAGQSAIVQPYLSRVEQDGELNLVFIGQQFSHAVRRGAVLGPSAAIGPARREERRLAVASANQIALARRALGAVPASSGETLLYARVDLLQSHDGRNLISEVELIEPCLFHTHAPGSAEKMADCIAAAVLARD
jgi:glutathione synthase/RimK-type ligase-like ATP-grasp enzyme